MTLEEIRKSNKTMLTPADIAEVLGSSPNDIRVTARQRPELLNFPAIFIGNRVKFPRLAFLQAMGCEEKQA